MNETPERFSTISDLWNHCSDIRQWSTEDWVSPADLVTKPVINELQTTYAGKTKILTEWSFSQLCSLARISKELQERLQDYSYRIVEAIGVIGVPESPRHLNATERRELFAGLQTSFSDLERVWVVANLDDAALAEALCGDGAPSVVQLHGGESAERCRSLRKRHPEVRWWKAMRIREPADLEQLAAYEDCVDALLLDAWSPEQLGGTGHRLNLDWLQTLQNLRPSSLPWWLAGGISAEWIPDLLERVQPDGLDASSRLEISPGLKDLQKVQALVDAIGSNQG